MALCWQLKDIHHIQIFKMVPLESYVIFDLWSAVLQPQVIPYSGLQYFSTLSLNRHDFLKKLFFTQCVFWFSLQLFSETFFITRKVERELIKNSKNPFSCQIFAQLEFSWHFRKIFKYQVSWNSVHAHRRTDRHDEANSRFSQFDASNKEPFLPIFSRTQNVVKNTNRKFRGNSSVSSRSKPGGWQTKK